jgi:hypothetical protein
MGQILLILAILTAVAIFLFLSRRSPNNRNGNGDGGRPWPTPRPRLNGGGQWKVSQNGNPTVVIDGKRITVFASDEGWKYVVADESTKGDDEHEPDFSLPYNTAEEAKYEALAVISGSRPRHRSITE